MEMFEFRLRFLKFVPTVRINNISVLVQIMAWRRPGAKPFFELMMIILLTHISVTWPQWVKEDDPKLTLFVKLEELHIATARKPLIHQNQPVARYLHKKQPCMLWFMLVGLQHRTLSSKLSTDNQVIGNFCIPADSTNAFGDLSVHTNFRLLYSGLFFSMLRGAK